MFVSILFSLDLFFHTVLPLLGFPSYLLSLSSSATLPTRHLRFTDRTQTVFCHFIQRYVCIPLVPSLLLCHSQTTFNSYITYTDYLSLSSPHLHIHNWQSKVASNSFSITIGIFKFLVLNLSCLLPSDVLNWRRMTGVIFSVQGKE